MQIDFIRKYNLKQYVKGQQLKELKTNYFVCVPAFLYVFYKFPASSRLTLLQPRVDIAVMWRFGCKNL